jgi:hypothetical protein
MSLSITADRSSLQIIVTRVDEHRYSTIAKRDGLQISVPGYAFMRPLPHDLAHCVVEATLRLDRGFWASVADGVEFGGMKAKRRSWLITRCK